MFNLWRTDIAEGEPTQRRHWVNISYLLGDVAYKCTDESYIISP